MIARLTLENGATPTNRIRNVPLSLNHIGQIPESQIIPPIPKLRKDILKLLGQETPFMIERAGITPMLRLVRIHEEEAEKGIGKPAGACGVGEVDVDDEDGDEGEDVVEAEAVEPDEGVLWPENAVVVAVEEVAVLLYYALVRVFTRPVALCAAFGFLCGWGEVRAWGACNPSARLPRCIIEVCTWVVEHGAVVRDVWFPQLGDRYTGDGRWNHVIPRTRRLFGDAHHLGHCELCRSLRSEYCFQSNSRPKGAQPFTYKTRLF
jgi:hypothetical protein